MNKKISVQLVQLNNRYGKIPKDISDNTLIDNMRLELECVEIKSSLSSK